MADSIQCDQAPGHAHISVSTLPVVLPAFERVKESAAALDQRCASFETRASLGQPGRAATRGPGGFDRDAIERVVQDEDSSSMPSRIYLMLRSAAQQRVSKHAERLCSAFATPQPILSHTRKRTSSA